VKTNRQHCTSTLTARPWLSLMISHRPGVSPGHMLPASASSQQIRPSSSFDERDAVFDGLPFSQLLLDSLPAASITLMVIEDCPLSHDMRRYDNPPPIEVGGIALVGQTGAERPTCYRKAF